jgi:hypothetical protein
MGIMVFLQAIAIYCGNTGPGAGIEAKVYGNWNGDRERSAVCFQKIWTCEDAASNFKEETACITKHQKGELK